MEKNLKLALVIPVTLAIVTAVYTIGITKQRARALTHGVDTSSQ